MYARQLVHSLSQFMLALLPFSCSFVCWAIIFLFYLLPTGKPSIWIHFKIRYLQNFFKSAFLTCCASFWICFCPQFWLINIVMLSYSCQLASPTLDVQAVALISKHGISVLFNCFVGDRIWQQSACSLLQEDTESYTSIS